MTIRIAILAAFAGTLTLAAATGAFAQSGHRRIPGSDIRAFEGRGAPGKLQRRETGSGTAQPSISDQGAAGNLSNYRSRQKVQRGLPNHKKSRTFFDGNASVGMRGVRVQAGDYDGDGRGEFRTRRGSKISDGDSPIPVNRRIITGAGASGGPHRR